MLINFQLNNESFETNGEDIKSIYKIIDQLEILKEKFDEVNDQKEKLKLEKDLILKSNEIYEKRIYKELYLDEFIYATNQEINSNYTKTLRSLVDKLRTLTNEKIHGEIGFFYKTNSLIYNEHDLKLFYNNYFKELNNAVDFYNGIKTHFPKLTFSEHVRDSLLEIEAELPNFSIKIIKTLVYLNNEIKVKFETIKNLKATLKQLTSDLELHASEQGKSKIKLYFEFEDKESKIKKSICCDPHVKYNRGEVSTTDKEYYRLYFHMGDKDIDNGNVLIGHIGKHIE